jgi:hypothetical protein
MAIWSWERFFRTGYRRVLFNASLWACTVALGLAQGRPEAFSISGAVLNSASSGPIVAALVSVQPVGGGQGSTAGALTGADGSFLISGLSAGKYTIISEKTGFMASNFDQNTPQTVTLGGDLALTLHLVPWAAITGLITDSNHEALVGATVQLLQAKIVDGRFSLTVVDQVPTNDLGEYRIYAVPPGKYYVAAFYRDGISALGLRRHADAAGIESSGSSGMSDDYSPTYYPGAADPTGAVFLSTKPGQTRAGVDIQMRLVQAVTVRGSVGNAPAGTAVRVAIEPADPHRLGARQSTSLDGGDSQFLLRSIPPGEYMITARAGSGRDVSYARKSLLVADSPVRDVGLWLQPAPSVKGAVTSEGGGNLPDGLHVTFTGIDSNVRLDFPLSANGRIDIANIPPGRYRVNTSTTGGPANLRSLSISKQQLPSDTLDVESPIESLEVVVTSAAGRLDGVVTDSSGNAVTKGLAVATTGSPEDRRISVASVGDDGKFVFRALLPGDYRVIDFSDIESAGDLTPEALNKTDRDGQKVTLDDKDKKSLSVTEVRSESN